MEMKGPHEWEEIEKEVVDWDKVDETVGKGKKEEEKNNSWYWELKGETEYDKLVEFRQNHLKKIKLSSKSKRWWDDELTKQLKTVRRAKRGGKEKRVLNRTHRIERVNRWKAEAWEIVRWAKDPWRLKTRMRNLKDLGGNELVTDEEKVRELVRDLFGWDEKEEI